MEISLANADATQELGKKLGETVFPNSVILLFGELGAGKTTFVQGLGEGLGITIPIVSPTFTLVNEYQQGRLPLYHLDLYRLETPEAIAGLFPETYWEGKEVPPGVTAVEWANRLPYLPESYLEVNLVKKDIYRQAKIEFYPQNSEESLSILEAIKDTN